MPLYLITLVETGHIAATVGAENELQAADKFTTASDEERPFTVEEIEDFVAVEFEVAVAKPVMEL